MSPLPGEIRGIPLRESKRGIETDPAPYGEREAGPASVLSDEALPEDDP